MSTELRAAVDAGGAARHGSIPRRLFIGGRFVDAEDGQTLPSVTAAPPRPRSPEPAAPAGDGPAANRARILPLQAWGIVPVPSARPARQILIIRGDRRA